MPVDWKLLLTFGSLIVGAISLFYSYLRNRRADRARQGAFAVYVIENFRLKPKLFAGGRILLMNVSITNRATRPMSFSCSASIDYLSKDGVVHRAQVTHDPDLVKVTNNESLSAFDCNVRIDSDGIATGWLLFAIPSVVFETMRIEKYTVQVEDTDKRKVDTSIYLVKDITDENS